MSDCRNQAYIEAPVRVVWDLIADVERHPEWWPRVLEIEAGELSEGSVYRQVTRTPFGHEETSLKVQALDDCEEFRIECRDSGLFVRFGLTEAQGGTFVDGRMGMVPTGLTDRVFDAVGGRLYFRRWLAASLDAMSEAAEARAMGRRAGGAPGSSPR